MAGYRTSAPASDKGVYIGQARHAVKELITSLRGELATLEAVYTMMCQGAESTDVREEPPDTGEDAETAQPSREGPSEVSVADEDPSSEDARPGIALGPWGHRVTEACAMRSSHSCALLKRRCPSPISPQRYARERTRRSVHP